MVNPNNATQVIIISVGCRLPTDLRCSLRIHNGQRLVSPGLIGSMAISNHYQSESLLELSVASSGLQRRDGLRNCIPVSFCVNTGNGQFMALTNEEGHNPGEIFWPSPDRSVDNIEISPMRMHHFLGGNNFAGWLCTYAEQLSRNCYPVIDNEIYKFLFSASTTTKGITVTTTTAFLPELSSVKPPLFFFTYRISISMDPEGPMVSVNMYNNSLKCACHCKLCILNPRNGSKLIGKQSIFCMSTVRQERVSEKWLIHVHLKLVSSPMLYPCPIQLIKQASWLVNQCRC